MPCTDADRGAGPPLGPEDTTQKVTICDLNGDGTPEVLLGNGEVVSWFAQEDRVLSLDPATGRFVDAAESLGFNFGATADLTEEIECGDLFPSPAGTDVVLIGNTGNPNWLYTRRY